MTIGAYKGCGRHEDLTEDCIDCWRFQAKLHMDITRQMAGDLAREMERNPATLAATLDERDCQDQLEHTPIQSDTLANLRDIQKRGCCR